MPLPSESIHSEEDLNEWENSENDYEEGEDINDDDDGFHNDDDDDEEEKEDGENEDVDESQEQDNNDNDNLDGDDDDGDVSSEDEEGYNTNDEDEEYYDDQNDQEGLYDNEGEEEYYDDEYGDQNEYDAMVVEEEEHFYDEDYEEDLKVVEERQRNERLLMLLICCCCCFLLWATIGLSLGLWKALKKDEPAPTPAPNNTFFFVDTDNDPTSAPTETVFLGVPDRVINDPPSRDTTIFETGPNSTAPQGGSDTLLVQNGPPDDPTMPRAHALINFHWNETGHPWYNSEDLRGYVTKAQMCLQRQPDEPVSGNIEYSVCRLPNQGIDVETDLELLTGSMNTFDLPGNCFSTPTRFEVNQRSTAIEEYCVDVTPFMVAHPPFQPEIQRGLRSNNSGRRLQQEDYRNVLFVVFNYIDEQYGSDRFYSKEAGERAPKLILDIFRDPGPGATAPPTPFPTPGPTFVPQTPAPVVGTEAPVQTSAPTVGIDLGDYEIINKGCSICPLYGEKPSENWPIKVENMIRPGMVGDEVPCQDLDFYCKEGYCPEQVCQGTAYVSELCGCQVNQFAVVDNRQLCNVCGEPNMVMKNPNTFVNIPESLSPPGFGTRVICSRMLQAGYVGFYSPTQCTILPTYLKDDCGCEPGPEGYDDGLQDGLCNICGENMDMTKPDGVATIPDEIAIPGKETSMTCSQIQNACDNNECDPIVHCVPFPALFADVCGCQPSAATEAPTA